MIAFPPSGRVVYNLYIERTTWQTKFVMCHIKLLNKNTNNYYD